MRANLKFNLHVKKNRKQVFLQQMGSMVTNTEVGQLFYPKSKNELPSFAQRTIQRVHFMQCGIYRRVIESVVMGFLWMVRTRHRAIRMRRLNANTLMITALFAFKFGTVAANVN